jgi:hypothetical protein
MADSGNPYDDLDPSALNPHVRLSHEESTNPYADLDPSAFDTGDGGSSTLGSFARKALRSVIPFAAGLAAAGEGASAGAKVGGAIGEFFEPVGGGVPGALVGGLVGGFAGMMGGSYVGERAQDYGLSKLPDSWVESLGQDDRQQRLDQEQHPYASLLGGLAPFALTMTPFGEARAGLKTLGNTTALQRIMSNPMTSRVFSGALMGGMELGQEAAQGDVDWNKVAISTGFGLLFTRPNHFGEKIENSIPRAFGQETGAEVMDRYKKEAGRRADRARSPREPAIYPEQPEYQERGDLVRGQQDSGLGDLYDALTEQRHEDPGILGADAPHYLRSEYEPTLIDAWAFGVGGPGTTEATASGALERAPEVEKAAQAAQREEIATVGAPPTPDIAAAARAAHPEAFAELDALKSQHAALTKAAEESPTPEPLLEQVKAVEAKIAEVAPEVSAAYRRAAEAKGGETVAPAPIAPAVDHGDLQPIVDDVKRQFMAAGRPADEAEALGHVVASRMAARSEAFEGKIGTPQEIYRREGAEIRGADGKMARVGGPRVKPGPPDTNLEKPVPAPTPTAHEEFPAAPETPIDRAAAKEDEREKAPPSDFAPPPEPTPRERIEQAYLSITGGRRDEFVRFTELRKKLADLDRPKVDAALRDILKRDATASLAHHDDPRQLARADHDAAFNPYGEPFHGIIISSETRDSGPAVSPAAETAREPAGAKPLTLEDLYPAYQRAGEARGSQSLVKISDLMRESGASKKELQKLLLDEAKAGRVTIHPSTSEGAFQDKALQDAAIRLPGKAEPYTNVVFNDETVADLQNDEGRDLLQSAHGKISLRPGERSIITIMRTANASTAIHELGHDWLEMLKRDAAHPEAPQKMRDMWSVAKRELGVGVDGAISTKSHEKFANGYMRWLYEGVAPTRALDRVFKMFREWLLPLYDKMKGLQVEISPGLRSVFEYMHSTRDRDTVVTPHVEPAPELHDLHAAEAEHVPAEHAGGAADRIEAERPHFDDAQPPREIADEIAEAQAETAAGSIADAGGETGGGDGGRGEMVHGGEQAGHEPAGSGVGGTGGPVGKGGNAAAPEGGKSAGGSGPTSGRPESDGALGNVPLAPRPSPLIGAGESPFVDKAGNFKRANINVPDDVWKAIKDRSEAAGDNIDARRAPTTWGQTANLARAMGKAGSEALVDGWVRGRAMNAEQIVGLVDMLQDQATEVGRLTRLADESPEGVLTFATEQARLDMVLKTVQGATAEAGRALNIFRMMQSRFKSIDEMMRAATGRTLFQKTMEMKMMAAYETPESIAYLTGASTKHSYGRMLLEYWINGLISGPATHTTYMMGNALLSLEKGLLETPVAAALGALRPGRGNIVHFGEAAARLRGAVSGFAPAMEAAGRAASTGLTGRLPGQDTMRALPFQGDQALPLAGPMLNEKATMSDAKGAWFGASRGILDGMMSIGKILDATPAGERTAAPLYSPMGAIPDVRLRGGVLPVGQLARLPSRGIAVIHTFLRGMNYSMEKSALSYRMAANEGKTGAALAARVAQLRLDTPDEIMTASTTGATDLTLMGPAGAFVRKISELTNWAPNIPGLGETPVLKFIDPFVHIAANIIDQSIVQRTPAGLLSPEIRADLMGKNGAAAQDMAQARMIVGTAMSLGFGALAANGYVSGSGPTDRNKAAIWRMAGNQAHSVKIGDVWYQTNRLGPLGMIMGVAADMYDVAHLASQGDMLAAGAMLQHAITQNVLDESFMRGPAELIQAVEDPGRYGERYIQNFASSFVPYSVGLAQIDRASDPFSRQARTVMDSIKQKIPGLSETLFPRRDVWGEPLPNHDALAAAGLTAIYEQRVSRDMVNLSLAQLGIGIGPVDRTIRGVKLTDQQYDDFARLAGRMTKQRLDVIVNSPDWRQWPPGVRANVVKEVVTQSRESACGMIFMKFPSVYAEATRMKAPKYGEAQ